MSTIERRSNPNRRALMKLANKLGLVACLWTLPLVAYAQDAQVTDPQIAAIVVTANQVDVDAGKLAQRKTHAKQIKDFAKLMITDHSNLNKAAAALAHKLNLTPEDNATSEALKKGGDDNLATLKTLTGHAFDKAYVDHEVAYHQQVLDAIDKTLIPSAKNEELKGLLVKARPVIAEHLEHARELQSTLGGGRDKKSD
jgi:putative membrane protein